MASHHHHPCHPTTTATSTSTVCYGCCTTNCTPPYHPPAADACLPHYHYPPPLPLTHFYNPYPNAPVASPNPPYTNQTLHHQQTHYHSPPTGFERERYFQQPGELAHDHPTVSSLLRRIAALESSIRDHSSRRTRSLRDAAARTIQTHFRAFLVRRSRTLRQLKELASIKSTLNTLKLSVSEDTHFDPQSQYHRASKLLFKLDSIQGGDPMIRDGKKSICRELTRLLDLIDGFTDRRRSKISTGLVRRNVVHKKTGGLHGDRNRETVNKRLEDLVSRVDALYGKIPEQQDDEGDEVLECHEIPTIKRISNSSNEDPAKVKKTVRFAKNVNFHKGSNNNHQFFSKRDSDNADESDSLGARKAEEVGGISFTITEDDEEDQSHDEESSKSSDEDEGGPAFEVRREDGNFVFSAPVPVTMDPRADSMNRRKIVK